MLSAIKFADYLETSAQRIKKKRDSEKTRLMLLASAARYFEEEMATEMTVAKIVKGANTSHGTFYLYFKTTDDITAKLLSSFVDFEIRTMPIIELDLSPFSIRIMLSRWYSDTFRANIGLMRNLVLLSDSRPEIAEIWQRRGRSIVSRILEYYRSRFDLTADELDLLRIAHHAVGSMMDQSLFARYGVHGAAETSQEYDESLLTELHAVLAFRAIFGGDPPMEDLSYTKTFVALAQKLR